MEFWGVEVKAGQSLTVLPGEDRMIHLSQAALGETKKESAKDNVPLIVTFNGQKLVLGTLSSGSIPQIAFDLVFEKEFELSHNWKNGSVYFCGYKADIPDEEEGGYADFNSDDSEEEADLPINNAVNGKPEPEVQKAKAAVANAAKPKSQAKPVVPKEDEKSEDDSEDDSDDDSEDDDDDTDVPADADLEISDDADDSDDSEDESDNMSEDEETPKKVVESNKKRPNESAGKTPVPSKKVKVGTPQKTDGKKGGAHAATPHPAKQAAAKTPAANSEKSKTPKSSITCNTCSKTFNSDGALQSHTKAKHESK